MSARVPPPLVPEAPPSDEPAAEAAGPKPRLSRRSFLKLAGVGGAITFGGAWAYTSLWKISPPGPGLHYFTTGELALAEAIAEAFFPGPPHTPLSAKDVELARFADRYIGDMFTAERRLFKVLFRALDWNAVVRHGRGLLKLSVADRKELLETWWSSKLPPRRAGYQSLRYVFSMGYFEDFKVRKALGLRFGCDLSDRFPELLGQSGG